MGFIYKITNDINGKIYIGKTEYLNPIDRWKEHLKDYKKERCEKRPLYDAMNKYGVEHFYFEVIEETDNSEEREKYWINQFRTYIGFADSNGYNATLGGDGKKYKNYDINEILDLYKQGYSCYHIANIVNLSKKYIRYILRKQGVDITQNRLAKKICQIDVDTNEVLSIFDSLSDAARALNATQSNISTAAHSMMQIISYGYKWIYYEDYIQLSEQIV